MHQLNRVLHKVALTRKPSNGPTERLLYIKTRHKSKSKIHAIPVNKCAQQAPETIGAEVSLKLFPSRYLSPCTLHHKLRLEVDDASKLVLLQVEYPLRVEDVVYGVLFLHCREGVCIQETEGLSRESNHTKSGLFPRDHSPGIRSSWAS